MIFVQHGIYGVRCKSVLTPKVTADGVQEGLKRRLEIICEVVNEDKKVEEIPQVKFSLDLIQKIFPPGIMVFLDTQMGEIRLHQRFVKKYYQVKQTHGPEIAIYIKIVHSLRGMSDSNGLKLAEQVTGHLNQEPLIKPKAKLFEIHGTRDLYTYMLAFPDYETGRAIYIRTPLIRKVQF